MRTLALDVGDRRIGVAITDRLGMTVQGRPTRRCQGVEADIEHFSQLVETEGVDRVVVGLPLHMDGRVSRQSTKVESFANRLRERIGVPVVLWDERLTTFAADLELEDAGLTWKERRKHVDQLAAALILEDFLREFP